MIDELQHLESEHLRALNAVEHSYQAQARDARAKYRRDIKLINREYEVRRADLMKGDRAVPQVPLFSEDNGQRAVTLEGSSKLFPKNRGVAGYYKASEIENVGSALICYLIQARSVGDKDGISGSDLDAIFAELGIRSKLEYNEAYGTVSIVWRLEGGVAK